MSRYQTLTIPTDDALPHLDTALNPEKMKSIFQQKLYADASTQIENCSIERIKYKPQKNCHVSYRLNLSNKNNNQNKHQLLCSRFYEQQGSTSRFLKEARKTLKQDTIFHIPELDCVTWVFPNDRKLAELDTITDSDFLYHKVAPKLLAHVYREDHPIQVFISQVIRYVPEQSCSIRLQLHIDNHCDYRPSPFIAYGKTYYDDSGQQTYQIMDSLWRSEQQQKKGLNIPQPLIYDEQYQMLWQRGLPGTVLSEQLDNETLFINNIAGLAEQAALLHQTSINHGTHRNQENLLQELNKVDRLIPKFNAPHRDAIAALIKKLVALMPLANPGQMATLHGDLHLKNILVDEQKVYLIDLDGVCSGDPLQDIGSFIAAIINLGVLGSMPMNLAHETIGVFLATYCRLVPWPVRNDELRWHIVCALVSERIFRSFTRLKNGRMEIITSLVEQAEILLDDSVTPNYLQITRQQS